MQQKSHSVRNASKHIEDPTEFVQQIFEKFQIEITKLIVLNETNNKRCQPWAK